MAEEVRIILEEEQSPAPLAEQAPAPTVRQPAGPSPTTVVASAQVAAASPTVTPPSSPVTAVTQAPETPPPAQAPATVIPPPPEPIQATQAIPETATTYGAQPAPALPGQPATVAIPATPTTYGVQPAPAPPPPPAPTPTAQGTSGAAAAAAASRVQLVKIVGPWPLQVEIMAGGGAGARPAQTPQPQQPNQGDLVTSIRQAFREAGMLGGSMVHNQEMATASHVGDLGVRGLQSFQRQAPKLQSYFKTQAKQRLAAGKAGGTAASKAAGRAGAGEALAMARMVGTAASIAGGLAVAGAAVVGFGVAVGVVTNAVIERGAELARFSGEIMQARTAANMRSFMADIREANATGAGIATVTDASSQILTEIRDLVLPLKKWIIETLGEFLKYVAEFLRDMKPVFEVIVAVLEALGKFIAFLWKISPIKLALDLMKMFFQMLSEWWYGTVKREEQVEDFSDWFDKLRQAVDNPRFFEDRAARDPGSDSITPSVFAGAF